MEKSMPSEFHFAEDTLNRVDLILQTYVLDTVQNVMIAFTPVATQLLIIYFMFYGWAMVRGVVSEPVMDFFNRVIRLSIIFGLATSLSLANDYIIQFFSETPEALASVITGSTTSSSASFIDTSFSKVYDLGSTFIQASQSTPGLIPDITLLVAGWITWVFGVALVGYAGFLVVLAKIALSLLLTLSPIMILCLLFEPTKRFFEQYISQLVTYLLLTPLVAAGVGLIYNLVEAYTTSTSAVSNVEIGNIVPLLFLTLCGVLVLSQIPSIAASISGGMSISTMGAVNWAYSKTGRSLSAMRPSNIKRSVNRVRGDIAVTRSAARKVVRAPQAAYQKVFKQANTLRKG
jgi:type IV secretion system protein VirB6